MSDEKVELELQVEKLESRLAAAKSELARIRERAQRSRCTMPLVLALVAAPIVLIAAAAPPAPTMETAPFQVFDPASKRKIFEVFDATSDHPRGFALFDSAEKPLVLGIAQEGVSEFRAVSADGATVAAMGVGKEFSGFKLRYAGHDRMYMVLRDGEPSLDMTNDNNAPILHAGLGEYGGGLLLLMDAKGEDMVKFSTSANGAGTVVTYPNGGAGGAIVGLKGTMLCGKGGC